jgi:hypothetical protein
VARVTKRGKLDNVSKQPIAMLAGLKGDGMAASYVSDALIPSLTTRTTYAKHPSRSFFHVRISLFLFHSKCVRVYGVRATDTVGHEAMRAIAGVRSGGARHNGRVAVRSSCVHTRVQRPGVEASVHGGVRGPGRSSYSTLFSTVYPCSCL